MTMAQTAFRTRPALYCHSMAAARWSQRAKMPLFQAFLRPSSAKITDGLCIKDATTIDPACGSGNFLTESYLSLRRLENRVLEGLMGAQMGLGFNDDASPIMVSIDQFFGIEINDFAVAVAKTALWIAEEQMMDVTQDILIMALDFLPLSSNNNIHEGNALRMDWNEVIPASECSYIIGNPPFVGANNQDKEQKNDVQQIFAEHKNSALIDYVACWYARSFDYSIGTDIACAFVSTNSICQGEQVANIWMPFSRKA